MASLTRRGDDLTGSMGTLLVAWCAVSLAIAIHRGQYLLSLIALVVVGLVATALAVARPTGAGVGLRSGLFAAGATIVVAGIAFAPTGYSHGPWLVVSRAAAGAAGVAAGLTLVPGRRFAPVVAARLPDVALVLAVLAAGARVVSTPDPHIDVYLFLQDSSRGTLHGLDMYRQCWPGSNGIRCGYPYLPLTTMLLLPAWLLARDVRFGLVAALFVAVLLLRWQLPRWAALLPLLLVVFPQAPYSLLQSWTEPLLVATLTAMVVAVRRGHTWWAVLAFAVALATKQHVLLLVPLAAFWPRFGPRRTVAAVGLAALFVLPWVVAGPGAFWHGVVTMNMRDPVLLDSLDLQATLAHLGVHAGFLLTVPALIGAYGLAFVRLPRTGTGFALGGALVELVFDATNKQSFFNHYTLPMALMVIAAAEVLRERPRPLAAEERAVAAADVQVAA